MSWSSSLNFRVSAANHLKAAQLTKTQAAESGKSQRSMTQSEQELQKCLDKLQLTVDDEPLLKNYSCALLRDGTLLVQGKVYITAVHICFYSNILGWETKLCLDLKDVTDITKQKTARLFSNAIAVSTTDKEYFFASFIHRKNAYRVMQIVWKYYKTGVRLNKDELSELIDEMKISETSKSSVQSSDMSDGLEQCDSSINGAGDKKLMYNASTDTLLTLAGASTTDSTASTSPDLDYISDHNSETTLTEKISNDTTDSIDSTSSINSLAIVTNYDEPSVSVQPPADRHLPALPNVLSDNRYEDLTTNQMNTNIGDYLRNPAVIINIIIMILIVLLVLSMLVAICKLSELDPKLRPWLSWQPWCIFVCK